jgi:hypothetical protein
MVRQLNWDCAFLRNISPFVCPNHQSTEKRFGWPRLNAPALMIHDEAANLIDRKDPAHMATTVAAPLRLGLADHGRKMTLDEQVIGSLVLPDLATTVADLWIDVEEDGDDSADPDANGS